MPVWVLPDFNLTCNRWIYPRVPNDGPADESVVAQLYIYSRDNNFDANVSAILRVPLTGWTPPLHGGTGVGFVSDIWEVDGGSGRYYNSAWLEPMHLGFPNCYVAIWMYRCFSDGQPKFSVTFP